MIKTIHEMADVGDDEALAAIWSILGAEDTRPEAADRETHVAALTELVRSTCLGKGEIYAAERTAVGELGESLELEPEHFPGIDDLEDEIADELLRRLRQHFESMDEGELRETVAGMLKRISDEERIRLTEQILAGVSDMEPEEKKAFIGELAKELDVDEAAVESAVVGGMATMLPLLAVRASGFSAYLLSTQLLYVAFSKAGLTLPFVVYQMKNKALSWVLGPWGIALTTGLSAAWFGVKEWRRRERARKLSQLVTYTSFWRRRDDPDPLAAISDGN